MTLILLTNQIQLTMMTGYDCSLIFNANKLINCIIIYIILLIRN